MDEERELVQHTLFPGFVCRVAGLPENQIAELSSPYLSSGINDLVSMESVLDDLRNRLSESLHSEIARHVQSPLRTKLIRLRRDVFNGRPFEFEEFAKALSEGTAALLGEYRRLYLEHGTKMEECLTLHRSEDERIRAAFKQKIKHPDFQKALLISSNSLFNSLIAYSHAARSPMSGKLEQIERGLLRYYTRMVMKATPFGTFCSVIPGEFGKSGIHGVHFRFSSVPHLKTSMLTINKGLYGSIVEYILSDSDIRKGVELEINQTLEDLGDTFYFLTSIGGKEIFQRLGHNPVLEIIYEAFHDCSTIPYGSLVEMVSRDKHIEAEPEEAERYLDKLVEIGLLRFKLGIPEQEIDWVDDLRRLLGRMENKQAARMAQFLSDVNERIRTYETLPAENRPEMLLEIESLVNTTFEQMKIEKRLLADIPFYEDATSRASVVLEGDALRGVQESLAGFVEVTSKLAFPRQEMATMRHFFDSFYEGKQKPVGLLRFYEDFYREHFKGHLEKQKNFQQPAGNKESADEYNFQNPFNLDFVKRLQEAQNAISSLIISKWKASPEAEEINIGVSELKKLVAGIPDARDHLTSISMFSQIVLPDRNDDKVRVILKSGQYFLGYGKYFSRFLRLFDEDTQRQLYEANNLDRYEIIAEISGDANFNANLHPPLSEYEISYPTSESGMAQVQIKCTDIIVEPDERDPYSLRLFHVPTGKYVQALDLGFLNPLMRPPLFQLLSKFSPPCSFGVYVPDSPDMPQTSPEGAETTSLRSTDRPGDAVEMGRAETENRGAGQIVPKIVYRPRVVFDDAVVISRRSWIVSVLLFPGSKQGESAAEYFVRVNRWRVTNGIPDQVYVKIMPLPSVAGATQATSRTAANRDKETAGRESKSVASNDIDAAVSETETSTVSTEGNSATRHNSSRDFYKPQFIDFNNPLLVNLFGKLTVNLANFKAVLEERYPAPSQLPSHRRNRYVTEQIFQFYFKPASQEAKREKAHEYSDA